MVIVLVVGDLSLEVTDPDDANPWPGSQDLEELTDILSGRPKLHASLHPLHAHRLERLPARKDMRRTRRRRAPRNESAARNQMGRRHPFHQDTVLERLQANLDAWRCAPSVASNRLVVLAGQGHTHAAPHQAAHHIVRITYRGQNLASLQVLFEEGRLRPRHQDLCFDGSLDGHTFNVRDGNDRRLAAIGVEDGIGFVADPIVSPQKHGTLNHRGSPLLYLSFTGYGPPRRFSVAGRIGRFNAPGGDGEHLAALGAVSQ